MENHYDGPVRVVGGRSRSKDNGEKKVEKYIRKTGLRVPLRRWRRMHCPGWRRLLPVVTAREQALRAAIQLTIARDLVSSENYRQGLEIFSDLASRTGAPWRQLAMLLEARLYGDIYGSNRFMYDRRHLPADNVPENVLEWDGDMFRAKVVGLVSTALRESGPSASMPLAEISPLLTGTKMLRPPA